MSVSGVDATNGSPTRSPDKQIVNDTKQQDTIETSAALPSDDLSSDLLIPRTTALRPEDDGGDGEPKDDSEAETVLSSPVKRREALKKANGVKAKIDKQLKALNASTSLGRRPSVEERGQSPRGQASSRSNSAEHLDDGVQPNGRGRRSHSEEPTSSSISSTPTSDREQSPNHDSTRGDAVNPRKRKYRDSSAASKQNKKSLTKRQRRVGEDEDNSSGKSSGRPSPPARLRRHKRTTSGETVHEEMNDNVVSEYRGSRSRRATSQNHARDGSSGKPTWNSDSNSDDMDEETQPRSTRGLHRSVSTPGRPVGRDHKRHVNKYGFTRLAEACESGDLDLVKEWREKDPEQLEQREFAGNTPLQVASLNGYPDVVQYLLEEGCNLHCANMDKDTPLIDAVENGHIEVVQLLLKAGVDPMRQNVKGQQALDVITNDTENGPEMRTLLRSAIEDYKSRGTDRQTQEEQESASRPGPRQGLHFMARTPDNLLKLVSNNDREGVEQFLAARVPVDNNIVAAAAKTGDTFLVNMLLVEMNPKRAKARAERPMLAVLGSSHFEMVKTLTGIDQFDPMWRSKANGMTWYELAEHLEGPHWREEKALLLDMYTKALAKNRLSSSPVSKREVGVRRHKSPPLRETDEDMDDDNDPRDLNRAKRRLMSRKAMRTSSGQRSPSAEPPRVTSSPEAVMKPTDDSADKPKRKVGRPRTKSLSTQTAPEVRTKRIKSITGEKLAMFEAAPPARKKKQDDLTSLRPAAEVVSASRQRANSMASRGEGNDLDGTDVKMEDDPSAEAEERMKQADSERLQEEEAILNREREAALQRQLLWDQRLEHLPTALRIMLAASDSRSAKQDANSALDHFMPLQIVPGSQLDLDGSDSTETWISSYQAAGILGGNAAKACLGIDLDRAMPERDIVKAVRTHGMAATHRAQMAQTLPGASIRLAVRSAQQQHEQLEPSSALKLKSLRNMHKTEMLKFRHMEYMEWVNFKDFLAVKNRLQTDHASQYPHLALLPILEMDPLHLPEASASADGNAAGEEPAQPPRPILISDNKELSTLVGSEIREGKVKFSLVSAPPTRSSTRIEIVRN